jgi:transcriptional antiterminator RfaH
MEEGTTYSENIVTEKKVSEAEAHLKKVADTCHWYALYTRPRSEKIVHGRLLEAGVESFLPLYKTIRKWSDRKKIIEVPLFASYIFVKVNSKQYFEALKVFGAVRYITFEHKAVPIPEYQINNIKILVGADVGFLISSAKLNTGDLVEVVHGVLSGLRGELVRIKKKDKVVVRIDKIDQNLIIDIPAVYLKKI